MTKRTENILLSLASFFIGIILVELSLQSYGLYLKWKRIQAEPNPEGKIRILTLGESTTDNIFSPGISPWPVVLEKYLNEKHPGLKFEVINKAVAGTSTKYLVENLPDQIEKYRPHLVIAMMGINDNAGLSYLHEETLWSKLILVRIYRAWEDSRKRRIEENHDGIWNVVTKLHSPTELSPEYHRFIAENPERAWLLRRFVAGHFLNIAQVRQGKLLEETERAAFQIAKEAILQNPRDSLSAVFLAQSSIRHKDLQAEARNVMKEAIKKGFVGESTDYAMFNFINHQEDPELTALLSELGFKNVSLRQIDLTKKHYRLLEKISKSSGTRLAVMAYPATDVNLFRHFFTDFAFEGDSLRENIMLPLPEAKLSEEFRHIIFIENKNFPSHFNKEVYLDLFAKSLRTGTGFGHPTLKGHEMIARNAEETLSREWVPTLTHD